MPDLGDLTQATAQMLSRFVDPAQAFKRTTMVNELRPRPGDFERVFVGDAAARAAEGYQRVWGATQPTLSAHPHQTTLLLFFAIGRDFVDGNARAKRFPGAYGRISRLLAPEQIWASWKFVPPGSSTGMAYDGLVCFGDRWIWLPKPWKLIAPAATNAGHWTD